MWYSTGIGTREGVPVQLRKYSRHIPLADFVSWTTACFQTQEARDRFLRVAATLPASDVEVEPMHDESRSALVRWRPGKFLGLNDVAYAHGGRIVVTASLESTSRCPNSFRGPPLTSKPKKAATDSSLLPRHSRRATSRSSP